MKQQTTVSAVRLFVWVCVWYCWKMSSLVKCEPFHLWTLRVLNGTWVNVLRISSLHLGVIVGNWMGYSIIMPANWRQNNMCEDHFVVYMIHLKVLSISEVYVLGLCFKWPFLCNHTHSSAKFWPKLVPIFKLVIVHFKKIHSEWEESKIFRILGEKDRTKPVLLNNTISEYGSSLLESSLVFLLRTGSAWDSQRRLFENT